MKLLRGIYFLLIFLVVGEIIVRVDDAVGPFSEDAHGRAEISYNESDEWRLAKENKIPLDDSTYRVLLLGDSYLHGVGFTSHDSTIAEVLKAKLKGSHLPYKRFLVFDATKPANNTLDNYQSYLFLDKVFKPNLVILGYNLNDVLGNQDEAGIQQNVSLKTLATEHPDTPTFRKKLIAFVINSHLLYFVVHQINMELKVSGHIMPGSDLDKEMKTYTENQPNWVKSQKTLSRLMDSTQARKENLLVMMVPIYNLLDNPQLFKPTDSAVYHFFTDTSRSNVAVWNTRSFYTGIPTSALILNKYEEHPNMRVHRMMADSVFNFISAGYEKSH